MLDNTADSIKTRLASAFDAWKDQDRTRTKKLLAEMCEQSLGSPCTPQTVNGWFKTGRMDKKWLSIVASILGVDLLTGASTKFDENVRRVPAGMRQYPVISHIQAGSLIEISNPYGPGDGFDIEVGEDDASRWAFFLEIKGDSMQPEFRPGDRVLIDPEVAPSPGDYVAARNTKREATFKRYRVRGINKMGHEIFELVPLNEDYPVMRSDERHLTVIGTMIEHRRKYRRK